jgi:hypothetical protein
MKDNKNDKNNRTSAALIANAALIWKQIEDQLVPRLHLNLVERVVYHHLLRHSRLEGKLQLRFSILWLTAAFASPPLPLVKPCALSSKRALCASSNALALATSSMSSCPTRFTPNRPMDLCPLASPAGLAPPASTRRISC